MSKVNPIAWVAKKTKSIQRADGNKKPFKVYRNQAWTAYKKEFGSATRKRKVSGVERVTGRKTSVTYNIPTQPSGQLGSVAAHKSALRKLYEHKLGRLTAAKLLAKTKTERGRLQKEIAQVSAELKRMA